MKFQTLCSGSKGNCAVLTTGGTTVLIDLGMSVPALERALEERKTKPEKIDAVFITHEHTDHILGLDAFSKKYGKKVFVHEKGFLETAKKLYWTNRYLTSFDSAPFVFKDLKVSSFRCQHDSAYCCGYRFDDGKAAIATVTDLGKTDGLAAFVEGCGLVLLESNHDTEMLRNSDYPYILKNRIGGSSGHLSNEQAADAAVKMAKQGVRRILLGHLSENNNTPETAFHAVAEELEKNGLTEGVDVIVDVVGQWEPSKVYNVEQ